jgi:hypothetical protein
MKTLSVLLLLFLLPGIAFSQFTTNYPHIPRIDVHTHVPDNEQNIELFFDLRDQMIAEYQTDLAIWVDVTGRKDIDRFLPLSRGRMLTCLSDFSPHRGMDFTPEEIITNLEMGYGCFKIFYGPYERVLDDGEEGFRYIDDPAHEPVFRAMEQTGMPGASVHVADPNGPFGNRGNWAKDPVEFWRQILSLERVLHRHPDLVIVAAHGAWLMVQDAQIDFLRYLLSEYPNLYVDLAATFQYFDLVDHANLRDFMIEYSGRILFGTDIGRFDESLISDRAARYSRVFQILETDQIVEGSFFQMNPVQGLNLPEHVLENIYYRNALKIYPGLKEMMGNLGYDVY